MVNPEKRSILTFWGGGGGGGGHVDRVKLKPQNLLKKGLRLFFKRFVIDWVRGS